jgi:hypothetical protein
VNAKTRLGAASGYSAFAYLPVSREVILTRADMSKQGAEELPEGCTLFLATKYPVDVGAIRQARDDENSAMIELNAAMYDAAADNLTR